MTQTPEERAVALVDLAQRVEALEEPSREIDGDIHFLLFGGKQGIAEHGLKYVDRVFFDPDTGNYLLSPFQFTGDVSAAERILPADGGYPEWQITRRLPTGYHASIGIGPEGVGCEQPAFALASAALRHLCTLAQEADRG